MADSDHTPIISTTNESCSGGKYKGVRKRKWGKWVSEIRLPNSRERIWLGSYDSPEKAARAFDAALFCLRGPHATFNFPQTPLELEGGHHHHHRNNNSLSAQEIQELAAKFANDHQRDPPIMALQQQQSSESDGVTTTTTTTTAESSGDPVEVDHGVGEIRAISDWSFLKSLDDDIGSSNSAHSNGGFYKMHSGELLFPTSPPHLPLDYNVCDSHHLVGDSSMEYSDDAFSQQSFVLWNF